MHINQSTRQSVRQSAAVLRILFVGITSLLMLLLLKGELHSSIVVVINPPMCTLLCCLLGWAIPEAPFLVTWFIWELYRELHSAGETSDYSETRHSCSPWNFVPSSTTNIPWALEWRCHQTIVFYTSGLIQVFFCKMHIFHRTWPKKQNVTRAANIFAHNSKSSSSSSPSGVGIASNNARRSHHARRLNLNHSVSPFVNLGRASDRAPPPAPGALGGGAH